LAVLRLMTSSNLVGSVEGPTGRFMLQQMAAVAELEAGLISSRTKAALAAANARGKVLGGNRGAVLSAEARATGPGTTFSPLPAAVRLPYAGRHVNGWFGATPCRRATKLTVIPGAKVSSTTNLLRGSPAPAPLNRRDIPKMSARGLLSRQGEVAIAKRIEAGREAMIAGLCESPLTFRAVIIWRDELNGGKVFLHDIISSAFYSIASAGASARKIRSAQQYARHAPITSPLSR
jgi:hypothetical protein